MILKTATVAALATTFHNVAALRQFVQYTPGGDDTLVERADPILNPGAISGHVHQIFGASAFSPGATYESLQQSTCTTVGAADGSGNAADKSNYWHPSLYMEASNGTGYIKVPTSGHKIYYRDAGTGTPRNPFEFPVGFRMIAGDSFMRAAATEEYLQNITQWICHRPGTWDQGTAGGFPNGVTNCADYPGFNGAIHFPHCWNGDDFNPADPTAHIAYPLDNVQDGACPSSHPTRLPHIFMENEFNLNAVVDQVKPNTFVLAQGDATGYGWHADFLNGWEVGAISELMDTCPDPYYGNEDIGTCPSYKKFNTTTEDCKLTKTFYENVDDPGDVLPGCNPISNVNPAPKLVVAALNVSTDNCAVAGSSGNGGDTSASSASTASTQASGAYSSPVEASSTTAEATSTSPSIVEPSLSSIASSSGTVLNYQTTAAPTTFSTSAHKGVATYTDQGGDDKEQVVWITDIVIVTEYVQGNSAPTPAVKARHDHAQHIHRRGSHHIW